MFKTHIKSGQARHSQPAASEAWAQTVPVSSQVLTADTTAGHPNDTL